MPRLALSLLGCLAFAGASAGAAEAATRPLHLGFADGVFSADPLAAPWYQRASAAGADVLDVTLGWGAVAPAAPAGDPTNPDNPAYDFSATDGIIRAAGANGLRVVLRIAGAPAWSDGPGRPSSVTPGTWRTRAGAYGAFATAAARHYDGNHGVPRIRYWQAGGEVNLSTYFAPQWVRRNGHLVSEAPRLYRSLLNAFYRGVKSVSASNTVIAAGLAPFGDPPGGQRTPPALFLRELLCLRGYGLRPVRCSNPAHLDAISHHPYATRSPDDGALNRDDASIADLGKLTRVVRKASRTHRVLPRGPKGFWVTEFSYDGNPPDPDGVPEVKRSRWIAEAFERFWRQGVNNVIWFNIRDQAGPDYPSTYQSGMYTFDGEPKRGLRAYAFPFVVRLQGRRPARVWGRTPIAGLVQVQRRDGSAWRTVWSTHAGARHVFFRRMRVRNGTYRAVVADRTSLPYRAR